MESPSSRALLGGCYSVSHPALRAATGGELWILDKGPRPLKGVIPDWRKQMWLGLSLGEVSGRPLRGRGTTAQAEGAESCRRWGTKA